MARNGLLPDRTGIGARIRGRVVGGAVLAVLSILLLAIADRPPTAAGWRPNVILIVVDTLRADRILDVDDSVDTPAIDALARDGTLYPLAFSSSPATNPSHASLLSSRLPSESGVRSNFDVAPDDLPLLTGQLADCGYQTMAVVGLATLSRAWGLDRDFEVYDDDFWHIDRAEGVMDRLRTALSGVDGDCPLFLFAHFSDPHEPYNAHGTANRTARLLVDGTESRQLTTSEMTQLDIELDLDPGVHVLRIEADEPFKIPAVEVSTAGRRRDLRWTVGRRGEYAVECELTFEAFAGDGAHRLKMRVHDRVARPDLPERYDREVEHVDRAVGQLIEELKARGLYEESLIVFTSDHGEALGIRRDSVGHVRTLFDEVLHVPLIIKPPSTTPSAKSAALERHREQVVAHQDIVPTILELIDAPPLDGQQGVSLLRPSDQEVVAETFWKEKGIELAAIRDRRFKMIYDAPRGRFSMFDLSRDPNELIDVLAESSGERRDWPRRLEEIVRRARARHAEASNSESFLERAWPFGRRGREADDGKEADDASHTSHR